MNVQIISSSKSDGYTFFSLACGKMAADITVGPSRVSVVNKNACHRAWGGMGRSFDSFDAALSAYKSSAMKTMIEAAKNFI